MDYPKKVIPIEKNSEIEEFTDNYNKEPEKAIIEDKSELLIQEDLREIFKE